MGKTVVKSDHGNYIGERPSPIQIQEYGPSRGLYDEPMVRLPWLVYEDGSRRDIGTEDADSTHDFDSSIVAERVQDLGYRS